jgi:Ca-activated chloride channel homolog
MNRIKRTGTLFIAFLLVVNASRAQKTNHLIKKGNQLYMQEQYTQAEQLYQQAAASSPGNGKAGYNLGNALYKNKKNEEALKSYDAATANLTTKEDRSKAWYNKGVVLSKDKKLPEAIEAYKNALKQNPGDDQARENLQKALNELKKQQEQQKKQDKKDDKKDKKKEQEQEQPKPKPSNLNKQQVEQLLKALQQKEKALQDKMQKSRMASPKQPEKDW